MATVGATILFGLHLIVVTLPVLLIRGKPEGKGIWVFFADFPLYVSLMHLGLLKSDVGFYSLVCVLGPMMYAAIGALLGSAFFSLLAPETKLRKENDGSKDRTYFHT